VKINNSEFKNLCIKRLSNNISETEETLLNDLIEKSEKLKLEFIELKQLWQNLSIEKLNYSIDVDEEWKKVDSEIHSKTENIIPQFGFLSKLRGSFQGKTLKPALVSAFTVILIIISISYFGDFNSKNELKEIITANNQKVEIALSDGSKIFP
jgi:hypothetical protein